MKQDKFLVGILIGIVLLIAAALVLFFQRQNSQGYMAEDTPTSVINNYVYAIQQGDLDRAYSYLVDSQGKPSPVAFRSALFTGRFSDSSTGVRIIDEKIIEKEGIASEAVVHLEVLYSNSGPFEGVYHSEDAARLRLQDGEWKISYMPHPYWQWDWYDEGNDL